MKKTTSSISVHQRGFTLLELLVVIVIISILAGITVIAFNGIQQQARATAATSGLSQSTKKLEYYKIENGSYPTTGNLSAAGVSDTDTTYQYSSDGTTFCITGTNGNVSYKATDTTTPGQGGCAGHGQNGQAAITNLAVNPAATAFTGNNDLGWQNSRWPANGTYTLVANTSDGPVAGLRTNARYTFTQAVGTGRGFSNVGNPDAASPGTFGAPVTAGKTYTYSAYIRSSDGQGNGVIRVRYVDASNNWLGSSAVSPLLSLAGGQWVRPVVTATAPVGAVKVQMYIIQGGTIPTHTIGDTIDGTGLMVTEGTTAYNYADGSSNNWIWNGTAHNSASIGPAL